jgi:hypothetical protein
MASSRRRPKPSPKHIEFINTKVPRTGGTWLAPAAPTPARAATAAPSATTASTYNGATPAGPTATASTATPTDNDGGELHAATGVFLVEEVERGETDVGHFLFAKYEALIGRDVVRLRDIRGG